MPAAQYFCWVTIALGIELFGNRDDSRFYVRLTHGLGWHHTGLAMHHRCTRYCIVQHGTVAEVGTGWCFFFTLFAGLGLRRLYVAVLVIN